MNSVGRISAAGTHPLITRYIEKQGHELQEIGEGATRLLVQIIDKRDELDGKLQALNTRYAFLRWPLRNLAVGFSNKGPGYRNDIPNMIPVRQLSASSYEEFCEQVTLLEKAGLVVSFRNCFGRGDMVGVELTEAGKTFASELKAQQQAV